MSTQLQNQYLDFLIDPSFQGANMLFVLSFEDNIASSWHTRCFLPKLEKRGLGSYNRL